MRIGLPSELRFVPTQVLAVTVLLTLLLFIPQILLNWQASSNFNSIIKHEFKLQILSDEITYFDEALTMSAHLNAATGSNLWEQRYRQFEAKLDTAIKELMKLAPETYETENAKIIDAANKQLIMMEYQSFDLVRKNQKEAAQLLLSSKEYENQKQIYADGVATRKHYISHQLQQKIAEYRQKIFWAILVSIISLMFLIPAWFLVLNLLQEYLKAKKIAQVALEESNNRLEIQVAARTEILNQKNIQLQQTLKELQRTQVQLIQTEKMSSLGQLVAGIAHEINNPVNFIYGNLTYVKQYTQQLLALINLYQQEYFNPSKKITSFIDDNDLNFIIDDLSKVLSSMTIGANRIREIVLNLRNFSRLDEAEMKLVNIHEGIDSTLSILQSRLKEKHEQQEIVIIKNYGNLPFVECYAGAFNQVLMNILSNAIDALHQKEFESLEEITQISSCITISTQVKNEESVMICIKDNGLGITEENKTKLFDPFFTTKPIGKGTGLGLSISYQIIVDKHKGKIDCISAFGKGAEFIIEIPIKQTR
jgi:signal transduction histidine kinase